MKLPTFFTTVTPLSKALAMLLVVALPFAGYYFGTKYQKCDKSFDQVSIPSIPDRAPTAVPATTGSVINPGTNLPVSWLKPQTSGKIIPIVKNGVLNIYSLIDKKTTPTSYQTGWGSGAMGQGSDTPLSSPDNNFIAFINRNDGNSLYLFPAGATTAIKVTNYPITFLTGWSPDSSKILFYTSQDNLQSRKKSEPMGNPLPWATEESFIKGGSPGFHAFDVHGGFDTYLYPLLSVDQFVDNNRVLVELTQDDGTQDKRLVLFNLNTFKADYATVGYPIRSFSVQRSFTANGSHWARAVDGGSTDSGVQIIFSKFPDQEGDTVDSAKWAFIQKPLLSPTGRFLAYTKRGTQITSGQYAGQYPNNTIIWDPVTKTITKELTGFPLYWVNETFLLIGRTESGTNLSNFATFDLYHADTQQIDSIPVK